MPFEPITTRTSELNGDSASLAVDRAVHELAHGRFVVVVDAGRSLIVAALEATSPEAVDRLRAFASDPALILTPERAMALKADTLGPIAAPLAALGSHAAACELAGLGDAPGARPDVSLTPWTGSQELVAAAFRLAKLARIVPALVGVESDREAADASLTRVDLAAVDRAVRGRVPELKRVSECRVPLVDAESSTVTLFRDPFGGAEHLAVMIGAPDLATSVPVRLHSACLTGDVLGSLRCDCGEQLRTAVRRIAALGGGVLLYLDQEGRGIGLANKLRAYTYQDAGLDTLDADRHLGFRADERSYGVAAAMLESLGIRRVRLLTNNPQKIEALRELGIDVIGRLPLITSTNIHNERYLRAKRERAGHLSEDTGS